MYTLFLVHMSYFSSGISPFVHGNKELVCLSSTSAQPDIEA